ncbi:MAG TPA: YraN family protein [Candidatus Krumholzibacteria bacterium]|nr:YraN family protein [Candidatus Krumholzibacteria bacterium]
MSDHDPLRGAVERGRAGEDVAALYLRLQGFSILDRNRRGDGGEIDLVAREGTSLVFVEVRLRRAGARVPAAESISAAKRLRLRAVAGRLLRDRDDLAWPARTVRFDVVTLRLDDDGLDLRHLRAVRV